MAFGSPVGPMPLSMGIDLLTLGYSSAKRGVRKLLRKPGREYADPSSFEVSGVVPAYQGEHSLEHTVRSLFDQTLPLKNVIVVDDASPDGTGQVAKRLQDEFGDRLVYLRRERNSGKAANLNFATLDERIGDIMYVLDCDCEAKPDAVEKLVRNFTDEKIAAVTSYGYVLPPNDWLARQFHHGMSWSNSLFKFRKQAQADRNAMFVVCGASTALRTEVVREVPFRELTKTEDTDETWRLQEAGYRVLYEPESEAFSQDLERFSSMRTQWSRHYAGTFQGLITHNKDLLKAKPLLFTTILPGTIDALVGTLAYAAFPFIAGAELSGVVDVPYFTGTTIAQAAALDLALTAIPTAALEPKRLAHLPQIYAYRMVGTSLTIKAAGITAWEALTGQREKWSNRWGRDYNNEADPIQSISADYLQTNLESFDALESNWTALGEKAWDQGNFMMDLEGKWDLSLRAHAQDRLVGYLIGSKASPTRGRVNKILVDGQVRGGGHGHKLLDAFEQRCAAMGLAEVELKALVDNESANKFYSRHGYTVIDTITGDDGKDRFLYLKRLIDAPRDEDGPEYSTEPSLTKPAHHLAISPYLFQASLEHRVQASRSRAISTKDLPYVTGNFKKARSMERLIESLNDVYNIEHDAPRQFSTYSVATALERLAKDEKPKVGKGIKQFMQYVTDTYNEASDEKGKRLTNQQIASQINDRLREHEYTGKEFKQADLNKYLHLSEDLGIAQVDWKTRRMPKEEPIRSYEPAPVWRRVLAAGTSAFAGMAPTNVLRIQ